MTEASDNAEKSTIPMAAATTYPTTRPNNTDNCFQKDFAKMLNPMQQAKVMPPRIRFFAEPKSALPLPPPKDAAPTDNRENPIAVTTLAATTGVINLVQYFASSPRMPSAKPPISTAPMMAS